MDELWDLRNDYHWEVRCASHDHVSNDEHGLRKHTRSRPAQLLQREICEEGSSDEANSIGDENQRNDGIANAILFLHIRDQSTSSYVSSQRKTINSFKIIRRLQASFIPFAK